MSYTSDYYLALITSQYKTSPKFMAWMDYLISIIGDASTVADSIVAAFDIDTAVGLQFDTLGVLIGLTRAVKTPISGIFFEWDYVSSPPGLRCWGTGSWRDPSEGSTVMTILPDDAYRQILKFKILTNSWDGTLPGLYNAWDAIFAADGLVLSVEDTGSLHLIYTVTGDVIPATIEYILLGNYIPIKPAGVSLTYVFVEI